MDDLRVRARTSWHFGASAGRADARRHDGGDVVTSSRSGNAADARPPPRPSGLRPTGLRGAVPAGCVARSLHTAADAAGMLVARALPAGTAERSPGASSKMYTLFPDGPLGFLATKIRHDRRPIR